MNICTVNKDVAKVLKSKDVAKVLKSKGEVKGEWCWEDLPIDLVQLISSSLSLGDCIRFRLICKTWISITSPLRSNPPLIQSNSESQPLPWLMSIPVTNKGACSFYHPIYSDTYTMDIPEIAGALIHDSKYGWLLLSREKTFLFFFNPLTMENIKLPDNEEWHLLYGVSFSSPPTSSDCVVFGITQYHEKFVEMLIYSKNDEDSWYDFRVDTKVPYEFMASDCNPLFCDGVFYCLSKDGKLGCFNPMESEDDDLIWKVLPVPPVFCFSKLMDFTTDIRGFIGEYDGEIISVFVGVDGKQIEVYKLDRSELKWVKLDNLGDKVLFLGQKTCMLVTARLKGIENRIYLPRFKENANVFYSLRSGQYHWFGAKETRADWIDTSEHWNCEWILPTFPV
ncbi:F-box family protein [Thalictrum thalictroides]|uniref:F-box family protein n=1 Tax=Thalictrum thalictroides TaxID=46969 RepID=A0A7J6VYJ1_THATH|nr:F-box family protein [Thalictrum thalictroides]